MTSVTHSLLYELIAEKEAAMTGKPLFIPLRSEWYSKIESGEKNTEYRAYGPRWNERTCRVGRKAVVSRGYGKQHRLSKQVTSFAVLPWYEAPQEAQDIYPSADRIAAIGLGAPLRAAKSPFPTPE